MQLQKILKEPYPFFSLEEAMKRDIFFGVFVTIFLLAFTPFGLKDFAYDRFYIIIGYGVVTYSTVALNDLAGYWLIPRLFGEATWTVYRQIVWATWHLFLLGVTNLIYAFLVGAFPLTWTSFAKLELYVLMSSIIPIAMITILRQNYLLKQNLKQAAEMNKDILDHKSFNHHRNPGPLLRFMADNGKDFVELTASSIVLISSEDNYVKFFYQKENKIEKHLLRTTLTRIEGHLSSVSAFIRCHRAYIININKVTSVEGNSQGYRVTLENIPEAVPVARAKNKAIKDLIHVRPAA